MTHLQITFAATTLGPSLLLLGWYLVLAAVDAIRTKLAYSDVSWTC